MDQTAPAFRIVSASRGWDWLVEGFELFKRNPGLWIAFIVIWGMAYLLGGVMAIGQLVLPLFTPVLLGGLMIGCAQLKQGEELEINHLFAGFQKPFVPLLLVGVALLLAQLAIGALMVTMLFASGAGALFSGLLAGHADPALGLGAAIGSLGFALLLVLLVALVLYSVVWLALAFAPALVALGGVQPLPALQTSLKAALANWLPLSVYGLITIGLSIVAVIPLGLGLLVLLPVMIAANYAAYRDVFADLPEQLPAD